MPDAVAAAVLPQQTPPPPERPTSAANGVFATAFHNAVAAQQPSVALGTMLTAYADGGGASAIKAAETTATTNGLQRPGVGPVSDDWGVASLAPALTSNTPGAHVIEAGERYLGVPYLWGGTSAETGFDCSGFVQQVYADLGISLPRVSIDQSKAGAPVADMRAAQPGDLVFWYGSGSRPNHIGIYAGDNTMLVAPRTGDVVRYQEITRTPHEIRRILT